MGLLDNLEPQKRKFPCRVRTLAESLSESDAKVLMDAVNNPEWTAKALARELTKRNVQLSDHSVNRHRSGECSC